MKCFAASLAIIFAACFGQAALAAPVAEYWPLWDKSNEANASPIDHSKWNRILGEYVVSEPASGIVNFRYGDFDDDARDALQGYVDDLKKIDPREYPKLEQKAYWMNLYNALSVQAVLENFDDLKASGFSQPLHEDVWDKQRVKIARQKLSLNDIEHRILRPIWKDHRILFGLNCTTRDCPNLSAQAYTSGNIRDQLVAAGNRFINENSGVIYANGVLHASWLFQEYMSDFAADEKTLKKVFAHYATDMKALYVLGYSGEINYTRDSRLNMP